MKVFFRNIHLYLSLASGLIIALVCLTGGLLVFEKEIEQAWHPQRYFVTPTGGPRLPLAQLVGAVQATDSKAKVAGLKVYADPARTVELSLAGGGPEGGRKPAGSEAGAARGEKGGKQGGKKDGAKGGGEGGRGPVVYLNPYTGAVIDKVSYRDTFFFTVMALHRGMVGGAVGKLVVGVSTLFFLFIIGTGLVLWWPATRKAVRQRLTVKWDASFKRLNHDLHIVLGFYSALFLFVFAFTGLAWSFEWFNNGIFALTHSDPKGPEAPKSAVAPGRTISFDAAYAAARQAVPAAASYAIQLPKDSAESIRVNTLALNPATESATDELYLDQYTGRPLGKLNFADRNLGQRVRRTFKPVHTGAIFGTPSKVLAMVVCLLGVTVPVTGTIMWLNRLKKAKKKQAKQPVLAA
ncbi:PepSY-associated TM helix domain-containing protein [Hymenobacter persicinus]|uniref:PepSY domain-containing protein n=1 Tax=Hymenobacter persicinus TaxID=2025506 RepID=A0A4V1ZAH6_9BACT|nr:PepSY-associated TM helix domain-containing protein [Hymenobacter persicinus]RYU78161.1 PepSY domain-containing protein [Hymenobacter persicinus]